MTNASSPGDQAEIINNRLAPAYQALVARYSSNFGTQWQVFALGLAAQGFVVGAASQVVGRVFTSILLSVLVLFIGLATVVSGLRCSLFAAADRYKLDEYERVMLSGEHEHLRLLHASPLRGRESSLPAADRSRIEDVSAARRWIFTHIVRVSGPTIWWAVLETVISIVGALIPILGIFEL